MDILPLEAYTEQVLSRLKSAGAVQESAGSLPVRTIRELTPEDLRDRFNYASMECGASVLSANREARETSSILVTSKDRYLLTPCSANKWVVVELCEEIGMQILGLVNYEFFSSMFKDFQVFGANKYPTSQWQFLGNFTAQNVRRLQYFVLQEPAWYKYIKIQFLTHHGSEHYCPLSELRVYGATMVDDLKQRIL